MLNHAGNSYITHRKQLCHPPDTVMSHMRQLYHSSVYLFGKLMRSGLRSTTPLLRKVKRGAEFQNKTRNLRAVCDFVFILKCHKTYITGLLGRLYQNFSPLATRKPWPLCHPLPSASDDITRRLTSGLIFWYVILEAM